MKIIPLSLEIKNFLSIQKETVYFKRNGCYLVLGENKDDKKMLSNGSGKTNIFFEALCFVLTDRTFKGEKGDEVIYEGKKNCELLFKFLVNEKQAYIKVGRKPNKLIFFDGTKKIKESDKRTLRKRILDFFGYDFELLTKFVLIGENEKYRFSFLLSDDTEKKKLFTKLTNSELIDRSYLENENNLKGKEKVLQKLQTEYEMLKNLILDNKNKLNELKVEIVNDDLKNKAKKEIEQAKKEIEQIKILKKKEEDNKKIKLKKYIQKLNKNGIEINEVEKFIEIYKKKINNLKNENSNLLLKKDSIIICPNCKKEILFEGKGRKYFEDKIEENNKVLQSKEKKLFKYRKTKEKLEDIKDGLLAKQFNITKKTEKVFNELDRKINLLEIKLSNNETFLSTKKEMEKNIIESKKKEIMKMKKELIVLKLNIKNVNSKLNIFKKYKFWFGKEGFKNYLFNKKLKLIENTANNILSSVSEDMKIKLSGMTRLKSGKYNQKINGKVIINGNERNYLKLSRGERKRIDLVFILTFRKLLNFKTDFRISVFDEPFSGIDKIDSIINILKKVSSNQPVYILSPETERMKQYFNNNEIIRVKKVNGISKLIK